MRTTLTLRILPALLAGLLGVVWSLRPDDQAAGSPYVGGAAMRRSAEASVPSPSSTASLTAVSASSQFRRDDAGNLILDADTAITLALRCEQPETSTAAVPPGLSHEAHLQVTRLQQRYCVYLQRHARQQALQPVPESLDATERQLAALIALRRRHFDQDTAQRLFGAEEAHTAFTLAVAGLQQDSHLGPAERDAAIARLRDALPPDVARLETPPARPESERRALEDQTGAEAAQQLQKAADIQQAWAARHQAFREQKQPILRAALAEEDKAAQIERLLRAHYSPDELAAARAYDRQQEDR